MRSGRVESSSLAYLIELEGFGGGGVDARRFGDMTAVIVPCLPRPDFFSPFAPLDDPAADP